MPGEALPEGIYERILAESDLQGLAALGDRVQRASLNGPDASRRLSSALGALVQRALGAIRGKDEERTTRQLALCNALIDTLIEQSDGFADLGDRFRNELLLEVLGTPASTEAASGAAPAPPAPSPSSAPPKPRLRPSVPLSESALFVNASRERNLVSELKRELASADAIDFLCPFLFWQGYVLLRDPLREARERGVPIRILTSTYSHMTQARVLDELQSIGAEVKISYEQGATRLHAKAWFLRRDSGFSTAFVGSSNLSKTAQTTGLEWNVRLSQIENRATLQEFQAAFENYWSSGDFESYDPEVFAARTQAGKAEGDHLEHVFRLRPFSYQQQVLDQLAAVRSLHDRHRNLIVAATGTGKTVIAALDYARLSQEWREAAAEGQVSASVRPAHPRLLFVAHRKEILSQARSTYRHAVGEGSFGELAVDGAQPGRWDHVFASVQALRHRDLTAFAPDHFDVLVVDETHHAADSNASYRQVLDHFQPKELLGLTATPERTDGQSIFERFGGSPTAEIRLWDAIDRGLLVPFQYFAVHDDIDLSDLPWRSGRYELSALEERYGQFARKRLALIATALDRYVANPHQMRALAFCVSVAHAETMAASFNEAGLKSVAVTGGTPREVRSRAIEDLRAGRLTAIFSVDVFNEGVDIPEVDTVLFLRPTESATLFTQQLGRGLRRATDKRCLTVLDFVGRAHRSFRFDLRLRALTGQSRRQIRKHVQEGFPFLPAGCHIELDEVSREIILDNLAQGIGTNKRSLVAELKALGPDTTLRGFLKETELELADLYRSGRTFTDLRRAAGFEPPAPAHLAKQEHAFGRSLARLLHVDDRLRLKAYGRMIAQSRVGPGRTDPAASPLEPTRVAEPSPRGPASSLDTESRQGSSDAALQRMLATALGGASALASPAATLVQLQHHPAIAQELVDLLALLDAALANEALLFRPQQGLPLAIHARYTLSEIMSAFGVATAKGELYLPREGVYFHERTKCNLLFVTLTKDEEDYSPTTMYHDYALSPSRFHWQSQNATRPDDEKGQRHLNHVAEGITPLLFVRSTKKDDRGETIPYTFLGAVSLSSWQGERPMSIEWSLETPMLPAMYAQAAVEVG